MGGCSTIPTHPEEHAAGERRLAQHRHGRRLRPDRRRLLRRRDRPGLPPRVPGPRRWPRAAAGAARPCSGCSATPTASSPPSRSASPSPGSSPPPSAPARCPQPLADWLEGRGVSAGLAGTLALVLVTIAISYLSLVVGELTPKRLALQRAEGFSLIVAAPLNAIATLSRPVIWLLSKSTDRAGPAARRRPEGQRRVDQPGGAARPRRRARVAEQRRAPAHRRGLPRRRARGPRGHDAAHRGRASSTRR